MEGIKTWTIWNIYLKRSISYSIQDKEINHGDHGDHGEIDGLDFPLFPRVPRGLNCPNLSWSDLEIYSSHFISAILPARLFSPIKSTI